VLSFSLFTTLPDSAADGTRTIAVAHGILAVAGAVLALLALLPRDTERAAWVLGFAGGALIVSLVVCALAVAGWLMYEPIDAGPVASWPG
jgi:hypothetical protein